MKDQGGRGLGPLARRRQSDPDAAPPQAGPTQPVADASAASDAGGDSSQSEGSSLGAAGRVASLAGRNKTLTVVGTTVLTAVVGALATALISPERVDRVLGTSAPSTTAPDPEGITYKPATSPDGALSVRVPQEWPAAPATFNDQWSGEGLVGVGVRAGDLSPDMYDTDYIYASAASASSNGLDLTALSDAQLRAQLEKEAYQDWTRDGCRPATTQVEVPAAWVAAVQAWDGCAGVDGMRVWDARLVSSNRQVISSLQVLLLANTPIEVVEEAFDSLAVQEARLPRSGERSGDLTLP